MPGGRPILSSVLSIFGLNISIGSARILPRWISQPINLDSWLFMGINWKNITKVMFFQVKIL